MKIGFKIFLGFIGFLVLIVALELGFGWFGVYKTKTIHKAMEDAKREVYEETNSFTKAKRQEAIKYYKEYQQAESDEDKQAIEVTVSMSFADFDEDKFITDARLRSWIKEMKY